MSWIVVALVIICAVRALQGPSAEDEEYRRWKLAQMDAARRADRHSVWVRPMDRATVTVCWNRGEPVPERLRELERHMIAERDRQ